MVHLLIERLVVATLILCVSIVPMLATAETKYPALFAFGDSILDTGNNNKLISIIKADYRPYGMSYNGGKPTGRFCDGKVPSDLLAAALGIKDTLPPYYKNEDLDVKELPTGVCFASGGAGYDNKTSEFVRILSLYDQLDLFKEYKGKLTESVGQQKASEIIANSLYILSSGNNDIAITYTRGKRLMPFPKYAGLLVDWTATFLKVRDPFHQFIISF
ncbi:PREDICTED: GDSL esterase/lipase At5g63170-like [Lupinus angustifolius]|uniref:GDSL esterase/lipase At5g63170-like n=1 Tax=Lupinus angustifolius TaxID=3871 RepID=UPI00092FA45E|nr:PREDICTED: GDSL esterase/lipase At5g63170-like [Lupinus angustifolius]